MFSLPTKGSIKCQILEGDLDSAEKQIDFLNEIQSTVGKSSELTFLSALLVWRKYHDQERSVKLLGETIEVHFKSISDVPLRYHYAISVTNII
jgi:tetratricopeptide repeat protein 21B